METGSSLAKADRMSAVFKPTPELLRFLDGPVVVALAIAGPGGAPSVTRGLAGRWEGEEFQVYLNGLDRCLIDPLPSEGASAAAIICLPSTLQTYQVKGGFWGIRPLMPSETAWLAGAAERTVIELCKIDCPERLGQVYIAHAPQQVVVVRFRPTAVFEQTPGPRAGLPLEA